MRRRGTVRASLIGLVVCSGVGMGCVRRPTVVTEPVAVTVDRNAASRPLPKFKLSRNYPDFWHAVNDINFAAAATLAENDEQRALADALSEMALGHAAAAEITAIHLLDARDSLVRRAARITYGALLSARADWRGLTELARRSAETEALPDEAGVAVWASAFVDTHTTSEFIDSSVTLPLLRTPSGAPVIEVRVNGVRKHFWLDTGSSLTIVSSSVATERNIAPIGSDTLEFLTAVGRLPARPAVITSLTVGGLRVTNAPAMIVSQDALFLRTGDPSGRRDDIAIDGIIGFDTIRQLDLTIDDPNARVIIRRPASRPYDAIGARNLIWFGLPIVSAVTDRGAIVHLSLDTGAEETYATVGFTRKTNLRPINVERRVVHGFGGSIPQRGFMIPDARLIVGAIRLRIERLFLYDAQYPTIFTLDGTLGADASRDLVMRIDMANGRFEITE